MNNNKDNTINHNLNKNKGRYQAGLSLVELLISMVIGLFMLAGVITSFVGTKDSDRTRDAISEMDANASAAFDIFRQHIAHAGYSSIHGKLLDKAFYTPGDGAITNPDCRGNTLKRDVQSPASGQYTEDHTRADIITVVTLADNPCLPGMTTCSSAVDQNPEAKVFSDCSGGGADRDKRTVLCSADESEGMLIPSDAKIYSTFRLGGGLRQHTLFCDGSRGGSQPLVDGIEAMQILYGIQQSDGTSIYKPADTVGESNWGLVRSVQIGLLMRSSSEKVLKVDSVKNNYIVLNERITVTELRRLYRVYTTTINLPNQS